jgi:hypothetical protein
MNGENARARQLLGTEELAEYWMGVSGPLGRLLAQMDDRDEGFTVDPDEALLELLLKFIELVEDSRFAEAFTSGQNIGNIAELLALLESSRFLRVVEMMERRHSGVVQRLINALSRLGGNAAKYSSLFYERLIIIQRNELLTLVFSAERSKRIFSDIQLVKQGMDE